MTPEGKFEFCEYPLGGFGISAGVYATTPKEEEAMGKEQTELPVFARWVGRKNPS